MGSLFRERDFRLLVLGQGISAVGTAVSYVALPLIAVCALDAGPFEVSLITAAGYAAWSSSACRSACTSTGANVVRC